MEYINLQLFATETTETLSAEMRKFYDLTLLDYATPNLIFEQFAQKRDIPKNGGKVINFRAFEPLKKAMTPLTEGVTPAGSNLAVTTIEGEVAQYGDYITQSDMLQMTSIDNTVAEAMKVLGQQAAETRNKVVCNAMLEGTNVTFSPKVNGSTVTEVSSRSDLDATSVLTVDTLMDVTAKLRSVNAPTVNGSYIGMIHPAVARDLMADDNWRNANTYGNPDALYNGEIGKIAGIRFVESSECPIIRGGDLASDSRNLTVNKSGGYSGAITSVAFDGGTVAESALVGKWIQIGGVCAKVTANTSSTITFASTDFGTISDNAEIQPAACSAGAVYATFIVGEGAYGVTDIANGGIETFVKQLGSSGTGDPINQRSSEGWKMAMCSKILMGDYLVRIESVSKKFSTYAEEN